jgi:hypothetical protein
MAFSQESITGFRELGSTMGDEVFLVPGDPGVTFTKGEFANMSAGNVLIVATDSLAPPQFQIMRTTVCPAATQAFPKPGAQYNPGQDAASLCLVPVRWLGNRAGNVILGGKINGYTDDTVISYTANTRAVAATTGHGADDRCLGALVYVYEGPGIGEMNIIESYDHAGGAAALLVVFHRAFATALTSASKYIVLAAAADANTVGLFSRMDIHDADEVSVIDGYDDGDFRVFGDWSAVGEQLKKGWLPFVSVA